MQTLGWIIFAVVTTILSAIALWILSGMKTKDKTHWLSVAAVGGVLLWFSILPFPGIGFYLMPTAIILVVYSFVKIFMGSIIKK